MKRLFSIGLITGALLLTSSLGETIDSGSITTVVTGFHEALRVGDAKGAMELLAPDAIILESGGSETRDEYEKHHLAEDMAFSRTVTTTNANPTCRIEGNTAWVSTTGRATGTFDGREVNSAGAELMVLTKSDAGWRIRAIHWSSHAIKKAE